MDDLVIHKKLTFSEVRWPEMLKIKVNYLEFEIHTERIFDMKPSYVFDFHMYKSENPGKTPGFWKYV